MVRGAIYRQSSILASLWGEIRELLSGVVRTNGHLYEMPTIRPSGSLNDHCKWDICYVACSSGSIPRKKGRARRESSCLRSRVPKIVGMPKQGSPSLIQCWINTLKAFYDWRRVSLNIVELISV